jgi:hypothetical protein
MPEFTPGGGVTTPFGRNEYLRSVRDKKTESYTFYRLAIPVRTIDGVPNQKILQMGVVIAKITSGAGAGMVGCFNAAATDGRSVLANIVGLCDTFLPWQLVERDTEIAVTYEATAVQGWCLEYLSEAADSMPVALTNTTAAAMQRGGAAGKSVDINWK